MSQLDSPRLIFCVLWRNYAYRIQDARLKKSLLILTESEYFNGDTSIDIHSSGLRLVLVLTVKIRKSQDFLAPISGSPGDQMISLVLEIQSLLFME